MKTGKRQIRLHEQEGDKARYSRRDVEKYKELINRYQAKDEVIGRDSITAPELSKLIPVSNEMFRKILNGQKKTTKRDYIILIGILLRMESDIISDLLSFYGMPVLNPKYDDRDSELAAIADEAADNEDPDARLTMAQINNKLQVAGYPGLEIKKEHEQTVRNEKYEIVKYKTYTTGDYKTFDRYDSIAARYDLQRYRFYSKMILREKLAGDEYLLTADSNGLLSCKKNVCHDEEEMSFISFQSLENTGEYMEYFQEMRRGIRSEKKRVEGILNDTKNYGERIGAGIQDRKFHIYSELYNYDIPECNEYYLLQFSEGTYKLSVFRESIFMKVYLGEAEHREYYKSKKIKPSAIYESEEELRKLILEERAFEKEILLRLRLRYYLKQKKSVDECRRKIKEHEAYVLNLNDIYDDEPDRVCRYFDVEQEYECFEDEGGMFFAGCSEHIFELEFGTVVLTLKDLYRAFELGFKNLEDIGFIKYKTGSIDTILD